VITYGWRIDAPADCGVGSCAFAMRVTYRDGVAIDAKVDHIVCLARDADGRPRWVRMTRRANLSLHLQRRKRRARSELARRLQLKPA
jgi:hypothetical protein